MLENVADAFLATWPDFPKPMVIILPFAASTISHTFSKFKLEHT